MEDMLSNNLISSFSLLSKSLTLKMEAACSSRLRDLGLYGITSIYTKFEVYMLRNLFFFCEKKIVNTIKEA
jgi:hypothetical protein